MNLMDVSNDYMIAHCISGDMTMGAGVAKTIAEANPSLRKGLRMLADNEQSDMLMVGSCYVVDRIANLVTKERYWHKPDYASLESALE